MTIRQLLDSGIEIEGNVTIKKWIDKTETYRTLHSTTWRIHGYGNQIYVFRGRKWTRLADY